MRAIGVDEPQSASQLLEGEGGQEATATASGFEIDDRGTIITNWHVVQNAAKVTVSFEAASRAVTATLVSRDPKNDLAVLRVPTAGVVLDPLPLGDSNSVEVGEPVTAIGNPFGYAQTLTTGVISGLQRSIQGPEGTVISNALQTDTPINPGSSGGPLLNDRGQVIGVNSQIVTAGGGKGNMGIAFAIPINAAKRDLAAL